MIKKIKDKGHLNIKKLGKLLQLDLLYFIKGGFWLGLGHFFLIISGLIISMVLARILTKNDFGIYQFVLSVLSIFAITSMPGINTSVIQATARNKTILSKAVKTQFKWSFLGSLGLLICSGYFYFIQPSSLWKYFIFIALFFPFVYSFNTFYAFLVGVEKFKKRTKYMIISKTIHVLGMLFALFLFKSAFAAIVAYVLTTALSDVIFFIKVKNQSILGTEDLEAIDYGKKLTYIEVIPEFAKHLDKIIIPYFLGLEGLAIYSVALIIPTNLILSIRQMMPLFFKRLINLDKNEFLNKIKKTSFLIFPVLILGVGVLWFILPWIMNLIFTIKYQESIYYSQLYLWVIILIPLYYLFKNYMKANKLSKILVYQETISSVLNISLLIPFIIFWGIAGAISIKIIIPILEIIIGWFGIKMVK